MQEARQFGKLGVGGRSGAEFQEVAKDCGLRLLL